MLEPLSEETYLRLLQRLGGSGYTSEPDAVRTTELRAIAALAARATEALGRAAQNLFLGTAEELLPALERVLFLASDRGLSLERRRARLVALMQGGRQLVEARLSGALSRYLGGSLGSTLRPSFAQLRWHRASAFSPLVISRQEPAATRREARQDLRPVLERGLPARARSGGISAGNAVWGGGLDAFSVPLEPAQAVDLQTKARVAPLEIAPGEVVTRALWLELQAMLLARSHGCQLDPRQQGRAVLLDATLAASESAVLSASNENRLVQAWGTATIGGTVTALWLPPSKTGTVAAGLTHALRDAAGASTSYVLGLDGTGQLTLTNEGADDAALVLFVRTSARYVPGESSDTQPWITLDVLDRDALTETFETAIIRPASSMSEGGPAPGAMRRVVYTGAMRRPSSGQRTRVLLDTSEDWRGRAVLVVALTQTSSTTLPHAGAEGLVPRTGAAALPRMLRTDAGVALDAEAPDEARFVADHPSAPNVWLFVDAEGGGLWAEMRASSAAPACCLLALVIASEAGPDESRVAVVPMDATVVQTIDLEQPQNCGCYAQGQQGGAPRIALEQPAPRAIPTAPPLGLVSDGAVPPRPVSWLVRERLGGRDDGTYEVRQKLVRQRRRLFSLEIAAGQSVPVDDFNVATGIEPGVNDQIDFRDRFVWVEGRIGEADITLAGGPETSDAASVPFCAALYTGPFADVRVALTETLSLVFVFSREGEQAGYHARLLLENTGELPVYVNAVLEASGYLGLSDLRQYGVIAGFELASGDEYEFDENRGLSDDFGTIGGSFVR